MNGLLSLIVLIMILGVVGGRIHIAHVDDYDVVAGEMSEQGVEVLREMTLKGEEDVWEEYVELSAGGSGYFEMLFSFDLSSVEVDDHDFNYLQLVVNYQGPDRNAMVWDFYIFNYDTGLWEWFGGNYFESWIWQYNAVVWSPGFIQNLNVSSYVNDGEVRFKIKSIGNSDVCNIDYLVLVYDWDIEIVFPELLNGDWWRPEGKIYSWQTQLVGEIDILDDVEIYIFDLEAVDADLIEEIHDNHGKVICYFSAGTYQSYRDDKNLFIESHRLNRTIGNPVLTSRTQVTWEGESWLDISQIDVLEVIMGSRLDMAVSKNCDAIEPDRIDGYKFNTGFALSLNDQIRYNIALSQWAHTRGLSIGLKNCPDAVSFLEPYFDFAVVEECMKRSNCEQWKTFLDNGKPIFDVEFNGGVFVDSSEVIVIDSLCTLSEMNNISVILKDQSFSIESERCDDIFINQKRETQDIWVPERGSRFHYQLEGAIDIFSDIDIYLLDLFDTLPNFIRGLNIQGKNVICQMNAGTLETWRIDSIDIDESAIGTAVPDTQGTEFWLDLFSPSVRSVMTNRILNARRIGCSGVSFNFVDVYLYENTFGITEPKQKEYLIWLSQLAHENGLSAGMENNLDQLSQLVEYFEFLVVHSCYEFDECDQIDVFDNAGKAVFGVEYADSRLNFDKICEDAIKNSRDYIKKNEAVDAWQQTCKGNIKPLYRSTDPNPVETTLTIPKSGELRISKQSKEEESILLSSTYQAIQDPDLETEFILPSTAFVLSEVKGVEEVEIELCFNFNPIFYKEKPSLCSHVNDVWDCDLTTSMTQKKDMICGDLPELGTYALSNVPKSTDYIIIIIVLSASFIILVTLSVIFRKKIINLFFKEDI